MTIDTGQPSGRELDALVAERVMGYRFVKQGGMGHGVTHWLFEPKRAAGYLPEYVEANPPIALYRDERITHNAPRYSTDIATAMEVEDRIAELGLQEDYALALARLSPRFESATDAEMYWELAHATPEQRCRAALAAIGPKE